MNRILRVAGKELASFFSSPVAFIFIGVFLAVNLFIFFWVETFFTVNIAEVRSLFLWMPILLLFLTSAVTMRLWAEERRSGTMEFLLTSPVSPGALVLGKFIGCLGLIAISLLLTLPIAISVSMMGDLDWGPVIGGYIAAFCLAAAYISIGLFVSVKSENQIVSLIVSVLVCSVFYLIGADVLAAFVGTKGAEILSLLGAGSRFESITRGVIDLRDLYYYLTIAGVFLALNIYGLERERWAGNPGNRNHSLWNKVTLLVVVNIILANFWLAPIGKLRIDLTEGNIYSISDTTRNYLQQLKEPLLIRGYFSKQTHPLLAPLVPRLKDLLKEYAIAGGPGVVVEFIDPLEHPDLEQEAGQKYGIKPVPFQTTSKYQAAVTNSYFDLLIKYGDQFETLGFGNLIEVKSRGGDVDVELENPEYDITRTIKKVLFSYQGGGNVFSGIEGEVSFTGYMSEEGKLPEALVSLKKDLADILAEVQEQAGGRFTVDYQNPDEDGALAGKLQEEYGFQPMSASIFNQSKFWFFMVLENDDKMVEIPLPQDLGKDGLKRSVDGALKRFASGMMKNIALNRQPVTPGNPQYRIPPHGKHFDLLKETLGQEHSVVDADLRAGNVPEQSDLLLLVSPEMLNEKQLFAVDQFLMQGGTVIVATSPYDISMVEKLALVDLDSGLQDWLSFHGIDIDKQLVMDSQNSAFPIPVQRNIGGFSVQETKLIQYPSFVDIREDGMLGKDLYFSGISELVLNWASPINVDTEKNKNRSVTNLLQSSAGSWLTTETEVQPDFDKYPEYGFPQGDDPASHILGVAVEGSFTSYFKGKESPLIEKKSEENAAAAEQQQEPEKEVISKVIEASPSTSRIICIASNSFLADAMLQLSTNVRGSAYLQPLQWVANMVDASLEEEGLLKIRGRSHFARPLVPMERDEQLFFEYANYIIAVVGLIVLWVIRNTMRKRAHRREQILLQKISGRV